MKKASKIILRTVFSLSIVVLVYAYLCVIFMPKDLSDRGSGRYYRTMAINYEDRNSLDVIMYGNSDLSSAIIPLQLYKDTGITSFMNWNDQETTKSIKKLVKNNLKKQKPKVIILETDCFYYKNSLDAVSYKYTNPLLFPVSYHTRWKELEFKDFVSLNKFKKDELKGHFFSKEVYDCKNTDYMKDSKKVEPMQKSVIKDIKAIKKMCDKKKIKLLFVEAPSPSSWNMKRHNGVQKLADELKIPFIDFNVELENYELDFANDFRDDGNHLNFYGATKVTSYLGDYFKNNYEIKDKRGNKKYQSWDSIVERYNEIYGI